MRDYPWRYQDDPYKVLVSEFMLHRTQARQVVPVYNEFIQNYPTLASFSGANKKEIVKTLKSLGLAWRVKGMISALNELKTSHGALPESYEELLAIRGIGQYIAGATICFSKNQQVTLVDTNTVRIIGRVLGFSLEGEARRRKPMVQAIGDLTDPKEPRDYYYGLIDIAHGVCRPSDPNCPKCPLCSLPCKYATERQTTRED